MNQKVFEFFEEISSIPRGSGNTEKISEYCVEFAKERGLKVVKDKANNVIIWKDGSTGREKEDAVIIQGHLDMVNEKTKESGHNFETDGLKLVYEDDFIYAEDTTLGGDDGIAIAYALAILDDKELSHPPIEAVFTVDEEIGMLGAAALDMSPLKGRYLLNIDSEEEGTILVSCAGGMSSTCTLEMETEQTGGILFELQVTGLKGGHSGVEIHKERANAVIEMGRLLGRLEELSTLSVVKIQGGLKDNAIPRECSAWIVVSPKEEEQLKELVRQRQEELRVEYDFSDGSAELILHKKDPYTGEVLSGKSAQKVILFLNMAPNGVQNMSTHIENLVETSLNLGIFSVDIHEMRAVFSVRSSVSSRKEELGRKLKRLTQYLGGSYECSGNYPAWEYKRDSRLRELMIDTYQEMYGKQLKVEAIHAGLECGYFRNAMPEVDIVSFGPDIFDIHTTEERMSISSVKRIYEYIIEILKKI